MIRTRTKKNQSHREIRATKAEQTHIFPSKMGWMGALWNGSHIVRFVFGHATPLAALNELGSSEPEPAENQPQSGIQLEFERRMQAFALGQTDDFSDIKLDLNHLTEFQRRVIQLCRRIRPGKTISYAELAERAGRPGAARAVGNTMAANRFPLIVPCHRVIGSNGHLGGYSGPRGIEMKRELLMQERLEGFNS